MGIEGWILTRYRFLGRVPGLADHYLGYRYRNYEDFLAKEPEADYVLTWGEGNPDVNAFVLRRFQEGAYRIEFQAYGYTLYRKTGR